MLFLPPVWLVIGLVLLLIRTLAGRKATRGGTHLLAAPREAGPASEAGLTDVS